MKINAERMKLLSSYMKGRPQYSFKQFARDNKLLENSLERRDNLVIECPFHEDASPSCSLNDELYAYHCFSCGRHGSYLSFVSEYRNVVLGIKTNVVQVANDLLRQDPAMSATLGFNSILSEEDDLRRELQLQPRQIVRFEKGPDKPSSALELVTRLKKRGLSHAEKVAVILMLQKGITPRDIWEDFINTKEPINEAPKEQSTLSIMNLLSEEN